jgi:hypothetical protein
LLPSPVLNAAVATLLCRAAALEWLAATAWNAAIQGGEAKLYRDTAVLLCSAGKFYAAHPMPETSTIQYQMVRSTTTSAEVEMIVIHTSEMIVIHTSVPQYYSQQSAADPTEAHKPSADVLIYV